MRLIKVTLLTIILPFVIIVSMVITIAIEIKSTYHLVIFDILENWISYKKLIKDSWSKK